MVAIRCGCRCCVCGWSTRWGGVHQAVVAAAGQGEFVDVGVAAVLPVSLSVVDLSLVGRGCTAGFGAAPVDRVKDQALPGLAVRRVRP